jgi:hypothetical protein
VDTAIVDVGLVFEAATLVDVGIVPVDEVFWFWRFSIYNYQMQTCSLSLAQFFSALNKHKD